MIPTYGVFALDPGGSSGLAWSRIRDEGVVRERLEHRTRDGSTTVTGYWLEQAVEIARVWGRFRADCYKAGLPAYFVYEDFILTGIGSTVREGLYPVWVAAATLGFRRGMAEMYQDAGFGPAAEVEAFAQQPSQAITYATDDRLKRWGLWEIGRPHERDAWRHLAYFVANPKDNRLRLARARERAHSGAYVRGAKML